MNIEFGRFRIGMRTIKTGMAVAICIIIFEIFGRGTPVIAALSAVFALRSDVSTSMEFGKNRIIGNILGGAIAIGYMLISRQFGESFWIELICVPLGVIILIILCDGINYNAGIIGAVSTLLIIVFSISRDQSIVYILERVLDTFIGTFVALSINTVIKVPVQDEEEDIQKQIELFAKEEEELKQKKEALQKKARSSEN